MSTPAQGKSAVHTLVRGMEASDLATARSIMRIAFGTFIGVPDPNSFAADKEYIATRWKANPESALVAEANGAVIGSNFATNWGSFAFFGPLTVQPELWNQGIAHTLLGATMDLFDAWGVREAGLFTFAHSGRHVHLYQRFGFWPRFLTAIMEKPAGPQATTAWWKYSEMNESESRQAMDACRALTGLIFEGLDVTPEIRAVQDQKLGETVLIWNGDALDAFAVCHCGEGTEAGANSCYIKFAAVRPAGNAESRFAQLLKTCEALAVERGLKRIEAGVNLGRTRAYRSMLDQGFRTEIQGVAMQRDDLPGFNRPDVYVVDDWR
jgi:N-acetylglutamate synthase-like GNAT family acetyltransferase